MRTILLTIEYDGTAYSGWQTQPNGLAVQQVIEEALYKVAGHTVTIRSSGRTDAGVHALAMPASFQTDTELPLSAFVFGTNRHLPPDIAVTDARDVTPDFNPIRDAKAKKYRYTLFESAVRSPHARFTSWHIRDSLDITAMKRAAMQFTGTHNFGAFRASNCSAQTSVRRIDSVEIMRDGQYMYIEVTGSGFLKNMVRIMVGTLIDIGRHRMAPDSIAYLLQNPDRKKAGVTAPACGLCLVEVFY